MGHRLIDIRKVIHPPGLGKTRLLKGLEYDSYISYSFSDSRNSSMSSRVSCRYVSATAVTLGSLASKSLVVAEGLGDNSHESYKWVDNQVWKFFTKYWHASFSSLLSLV
ncbi:hypothetical protein VNO80_18660 [Phaseolus coccineus]|uniref:Uncharacterized protein n=1 Tax=Phaseolus coccineus TaxID=3886 RepID=A0AAN9MEM2_PHACN